MTEVTKGMRVIAAEAINFDGDLNDVPAYALEAVIKAKAEVSKIVGYEVNLNQFFMAVLDKTESIIFESGK